MTGIVVFLFGLLAVSQAAVPGRNQPRIINGQDVKPGEIPYQISLQYKKDHYHFCGGSILNEYFVITAAHCLVNKQADALQVVAGTTNLEDPKYEHEVEQIIIHEKYNSADSWRNDIALIKVKTPFEKSELVSFVSLPEILENVNTWDVATVSGWGRLSFGGPSPKIMQRADIFIADQEYCRRMYQWSKNIYDTHLCAFDPNEIRGSCNGDSGGPLTVKGKLVGLVSWARNCADTDYPTVYTRVPSYVQWIQLHIA